MRPSEVLAMNELFGLNELSPAQHERILELIA